MGRLPSARLWPIRMKVLSSGSMTEKKWNGHLINIVMSSSTSGTGSAKSGFRRRVSVIDEGVPFRLGLRFRRSESILPIWQSRDGGEIGSYHEPVDIINDEIPIEPDHRPQPGGAVSTHNAGAR